MAGGAAVSGVTAVGPKSTKRQEYFAFGLITSLFFLWGFSYGLIDVLNKHFQVFFQITKLQSTMIQVAYFGAYIVFSPVAGQFMSWFGYKKGIYLGLSLYSTGAILFWPSAHYEKFWAFVVSAFIIACGLSTLEVAANSYVSVLGSPDQAAFRLNFAQSFNGLASFVGPLIASKYFFTGANQYSLGNVQYVYLAVACLGIAVMVLFFFATLPEISEDSLEQTLAENGIEDNRPVWKRWHLMVGVLVQFFYVGAQVTVASFVMNYLTDDGAYTSAEAARLFSFMQITFMVGRFASTPLLRYFNPATLLTIYGAMCTIFTLVVSLTKGRTGLACLYIVFFFESIIYPTTFTLATARLGKWTKRGAGLMCQGVGGGAAFPPIQGALADAKGTNISYLIPTVGFVAVALYGAAMRVYNARLDAETTSALEGGHTLAKNDSQASASESDEKLESTKPIHY